MLRLMYVEGWLAWLCLDVDFGDVLRMYLWVVLGASFVIRSRPTSLHPDPSGISVLEVNEPKSAARSVSLHTN